MRIDQIVVAEQILQRVRETLDLIEAGAGDAAAGADDRVAWTDQNVRIALDRAAALLKFADEAIVQAAELCFLGFLQIEIREEPPQADRYVAHQWMLDLAEPAHELGHQAPRDPVRQQEIDVLLLEHPQNPGMKCHPAVNSLG